jgi:hypothetical protein
VTSPLDDLEDMYHNEIRAGVVKDWQSLIQDKLREAHVSALQQALVEGLAQADRGKLRDGPSVIAELRGMLERRR